MIISDFSSSETTTSWETISGTSAVSGVSTTPTITSASGETSSTSLITLTVVSSLLVPIWTAPSADVTETLVPETETAPSTPLTSTPPSAWTITDVSSVVTVKSSLICSLSSLRDSSKPKESITSSL